MIKNEKIVATLRLQRDISKHIKRGHPWIFKDVLDSNELAKIPAGSVVQVNDLKNQLLAYGYSNGPETNLSIRVCALAPQKIKSAWAQELVDQALQLRSPLRLPNNNAFRAISGEGDGLPGLIVDVYADWAVMQIDGAAAGAFWDEMSLATYIREKLGLKGVYLKPRAGKDRTQKQEGQILCGDVPAKITITEHGARFGVDVVHGAKTGLFLDQRENRRLLATFCKDKSVLNLFGYTGGFSVCAGLQGAREVCTVDIAPQAIEASKDNWALNSLPEERHEGICLDAFEFIHKARETRRQWDVVVVDPPSFAPSKSSVDNASGAYLKLLSESIKLVGPQGLFAASSCSGHIPHEMFMDICSNAFSKALKRAKVIELRGQPMDHPYPMACPELRYLKFFLFQLSN